MPLAVAVVASVVLLASLVVAVAMDDGEELALAGPTSTTEPDEPFDPADPRPADWVTDPDPDLDLPTEWDERVVDLVEFVEDERGLEFVSPVPIEFLTEEEFEEEIRLDEEDLADEETVEAMEEFQSMLPMLRALGWIEGDPDLVELSEDFASVSVAAFYTTDERRIVVPTTDPGPEDEASLVHELTHALQDQYFDLEAATEDGNGDDQTEDDNQNGDDQTEDDDRNGTYEHGGYNDDSPWVTPLVEGDATRIQQAWLVDQSPPGGPDSDPGDEELQDIDELEDLQEQLDEFPSFLVAGSHSAYSLGLPMVGLLAEETGNEGVNQALHDMDTTAAHFTDPRTYLDRTEFGEIAEPAVPGSAELLDDGPFDAWDIYTLLSQRISIADAIEAADSWHAGSYATYEDDDRTCVRVRVDGATTDGDDVLASAFEEWVDEAPEETDASFDAEPRDAEDGVVEIETCDPGDEVELARDRVDTAVDYLSLRSGLTWELVHYEGRDRTEAWEVAECVTGGILDDSDVSLDDFAEAEPPMALVAILLDCELV